MRPLCFYIAYILNKQDIHPNTVTIWSMFFGAGSAYFFTCGSFFYGGWYGFLLNVIGIGLLYIADICDNTDGQLARLSGKKSKVGRILDGMAGFVWFVPIYLAIAWRIYQHHEIEFSFLGISDQWNLGMLHLTDSIDLSSIGAGEIYGILVTILIFYSGFACNGGQQRVADYYLQVHLFFEQGEKGAEWDNSTQQKALYEKMTTDNSTWVERWFTKSYINYTITQEKATPKLQQFIAKAEAKYGSLSAIPAKVREAMHEESRRIMWLNYLIAFKYRASSLAIFCLLDVPVLHFLFEVVVLGFVTFYKIRAHESACVRCEKLL